MNHGRKALRQNKPHFSQPASQITDEITRRYLAEELGIPAEAIKDAGKNLIGFFETLYNIDQRINNPQPTV